MITYLVIDPLSKKHYVGSTNSPETGRPWSHLNGESCNSHLAAITAKRDCFVFVSEDDGLDRRDEEQFYLDFYFGSRWCLNQSRHAHGGSEKGHTNTKQATKNGTHPWLSQNLSDEAREFRKQRAKEANSKPHTTERVLKASSSHLPLPIEVVWNEVKNKLEEATHPHFWGRKELSEKLGVSLPTLRKIAKAIRQGKTMEQVYGNNIR